MPYSLPAFRPSASRLLSSFSVRGSGRRGALLVAGAAGALVMPASAAWSQCTPPLSPCPPTLAAPAAYFVGTSPQDVALGDLNADGRADVVVGINDSFSPRVSVLLANPDGTLQAPVNVFVSGQFTGTSGVAIGRFNADAHADLVVCNRNGNTVAVLLGNGDGTFQAPNFTGVSVLPTNVAVGDLNADGLLDAVTANPGSNNVGVLFGNGDGTLQAPVYYAVGSVPEDVAIGLSDSDGILDLVVTNKGGLTPGTTVSVLRGVGNGTFLEATPRVVGVSPWGVAPIELTICDAVTPGFVVANKAPGSINQLRGSVTELIPMGGAADFRGVAAGDLNGDGRWDAVIAHTVPAGILVVLGEAGGLGVSGVTYPTGQNLTQTVAVGDINGDGLNDVATGDGNSGTVTVFLNETQPLQVTQHPRAVAVSEGQTANFSVGATGAMGLRWRRNGVELFDGGPYSGTGTSTLTVSGVSAKELGDYDVLLTPMCAGAPVPSRYAALLLAPGPACPADFNGDGTVNSTDVSDFINTWFTFEPTGCP